MGYSDTSTFLTYFNLLGIATFHGPALMAGFAQMHNFGQEIIDHYRSLLFEPLEQYDLPVFKSWCESYPDWGDPGSLEQNLDLNENKTGHIWLQGSRTLSGKLWGGCIEVLEFLKGTRYWPGEHFWNDRILIFETSEDKPGLDEIGYFLRNYGIQGIFDKIQGILFGRARDYSNEEKKLLYKKIIQVVANEFGAKDIPIVCNLDFGHTEPEMIIPLGIEARINCRDRRITLVEPAVL